MISDAVSEDRVSRIIGYKIKKGNFKPGSPNLPQRIAVFGEGNTANQDGFTEDPIQITSAQQAGELFGWGSPLHIQCRLLFPKNNDGVGGIPVYVYAQKEVDDAASSIIEISAVGTATANATHWVVINGRKGIDGDSYAFNVEEGDTADIIHGKIADAINGVLGAPATASDTDYEVTCETKWKSITASDFNIEIDTDGKDVGITYSTNETQAAAGLPSIETSLELLGNEWSTIVLNSYGTQDSICDELESFNGIPDPENPTGRFRGIVMMPFVAITGSTADDPSAFTDSRKDQVTIAIAPAPGSTGFQFEAAANMVVEEARCAQDTPHLDVAGKSYRDMPVPNVLGTMADYESRDAIVKKGCSTVTLKNGKFVIEDFVTTYHPVGENPPQFRYVRNLMIDFNVRYGYYLLEQTNVVDHAIALDSAQVNAEKVVKPKQWKQILYQYAEDLANRALIVDTDFMQSSIQVAVGTNNPDRFETEFNYKRSGFVRVAATTATAGFNFGTLSS